MLSNCIPVKLAEWLMWWNTAEFTAATEEDSQTVTALGMRSGSKDEGSLV